MKKTAIIVVLIWTLLVSLLLPLRQKAYADPLSMSVFSGAAYALAESWGLSMVFSGGDQTGASEWMYNQMDSFAGSQGKSVLEYFGDQIFIDSVGKVAIGHATYNAFSNFFNNLIDDLGISDTNTIVHGGTIYGTDIDLVHSGVSSPTETGVSCVFSGYSEYWGAYSYASFYVNGNFIDSVSQDYNYHFPGTYTLDYLNNNIYGVVLGVKSGSADKNYYKLLFSNVTDLIKNRIEANTADYVAPTVLNPNKEWVGDIAGRSVPDTNLEDLMDGVLEDAAGNNLDVTGEVIDVPVPPTPIPTVEPGDIDGYWNRQADQLEGLGNDIGNISGKLDDLGQQAGDITDALEGVNEGIQTQTGVISGALDQATQDVIDAIGEQTGVLDESLAQTAEGVQEIADALQPGEIEPRQFDLRRLFPFCIPFDIHNLLQKFSAEPVAPHVQLPFVIQSIGFSYMFDLDFSAFDPVAAAMRTVEFIVFAIGLAWATSKVIKW